MNAAAARVERALRVGSACIHVATSPHSYRNGKWITKTDERHVILLAVVDQFAMIRRPRAMPYVCNVAELRPL